MTQKNGYLRLAIPSDGALHEPTLAFLRSSGIGVQRTNLRRYTADIPAVPGVSVMFQRASDIPFKVEEGSADMGVVGYDRYQESHVEGGDTKVVMKSLGFGHCELVIGVPDSWVDIISLADLADLSMEFRREGRDLRIATKFPRLVEHYLLRNGIMYFSLVHSSGTLEAAPAMGFADIIADISSSGTTMRENRLKTIYGGSIISSEACLISNRRLLKESEARLALARKLVDYVEAYLQSRERYSLTANMRGETPEQLARYILEHTEISGLRGPTIAKVYAQDESEGWYAVTVIVDKRSLLDAVEQLRRIGADSVTVSQPNYVFKSECEAHERLV